ncbi:acyl-CoA thioesterase [Streptococcus sp. DD12]|uniref:acyl-CoA thioesterase n=1 Tax=Streptococcus sp. DD12 TaxID=1777880 RepID=UPI000794750D|nr:acyl-CoA thioesterase [Streptococcus sp. DD12]KXT75673.1 4-hydroxybenzoyl-CoA thioesterase family active site [Streptococcus sp. DD12]
MHSYQHQVQYYETDRMGITHHSNYIRWMEEARSDLLAQIGFPYDRLEAIGVISPVTAVEADYLATTTFMDEISISVDVIAVKAARLTLAYEMRNRADARLVCQATSQHSFLDEQGNFVNLKRQQPDFFQALKALENKS